MLLFFVTKWWFLATFINRKEIFMRMVNVVPRNIYSIVVMANEPSVDLTELLELEIDSGLVDIIEAAKGDMTRVTEGLKKVNKSKDASEDFVGSLYLDTRQYYEAGIRLLLAVEQQEKIREVLGRETVAAQGPVGFLEGAVAVHNMAQHRDVSWITQNDVEFYVANQKARKPAIYWKEHSDMMQQFLTFTSTYKEQLMELRKS
jgi:DNA polymerase III delta prime subunit